MNFRYLFVLFFYIKLRIKNHGAYTNDFEDDPISRFRRYFKGLDRADCKTIKFKIYFTMND